jgi:hypothetical protein
MPAMLRLRRHGCLATKQDSGRSRRRPLGEWQQTRKGTERRWVEVGFALRDCRAETW